jgi:hypothetical protein
MSGPLIIIVAIIYGWICLDSLWHGKYDVSLMFFGYAVAQAAVYMMATKE